MRTLTAGCAMMVASIGLVLAGCGTPKEKTAPCKRPANLASYAPDPRTNCGPMRRVNADSAAAFAAIGDLAQPE
jgi:hypothetical protein